jgi:hypothetical protein
MTKSILSVVLGALLVVAMGMPVVAQEKGAPGQQQQSPDQVFASLDTNKDMRLSEAELGPLFKDAKEDQKKQTFTKWDANRDGSVSIEEFKANYR